MALWQTLFTGVRASAVPAAHVLPTALPLVTRLLATPWVSGTQPRRHCNQLASASRISARQLAALLGSSQNDIQFVDIRERSEVIAAKISSKFINLPTSELRAWLPTAAEKFDTFKKTVVLCDSGVRSRNVANALLSLGFHDVSDVQGGALAYLEAGLA